MFARLSCTWCFIPTRLARVINTVIVNTARVSLLSPPLFPAAWSTLSSNHCVESRWRSHVTTICSFQQYLLQLYRQPGKNWTSITSHQDPRHPRWVTGRRGCMFQWVSLVATSIHDYSTRTDGQTDRQNDRLDNLKHTPTPQPLKLR